MNETSDVVVNNIFPYVCNQDANPDTSFCRCAAILLLWIHPATDIERNWKAPRKIPLRPVALTPALS
ncbi:TPA: hypothetical protein ACW0IH_002111, partial [Enterobacter kobei]